MEPAAIVVLFLLQKFCSCRTGSQEIYRESAGGEPTIIPTQESLIGDLLSMDIGGPTVPAAPQAQAAAASNLDLLGGGLDGLVRHLNSRFIHLKNYCQLKAFFH